MVVLSLVCGGSPCWNRTIHPAARWRRCHPEPEVEKEGMDVTIVGTSRPVTGGVDTDLELNVAAVVDQVGGLLGVESFPTTVKGIATVPREAHAVSQIRIRQFCC